MIARLFNRCLIRPGDVRASRDDLRVVGAFNPGAARVGGEVVLLVRVAEAPRAARAGWVGLPRWDAGTGAIAIDWEREREVERIDARVVRLRGSGVWRLTSTSHLRMFRCGQGREVESISAVALTPLGELEEYGIEDARITPLGGEWWITYVAVSRHGAATALARTRDFVGFDRCGIAFAPENKDVVLFPEPIGGRLCALHRPTASQGFSRPEIWLASSSDGGACWGGCGPVYGGVAAWESRRVGAGAPPVRTAAGWLEVYHGCGGRGRVGVYGAGALLLDGENPGRVLGVRGPVLVPETAYERRGFVPGVVFPTGLVECGETALVYYGAADAATAVVELRMADLSLAG